MGCDRLRRWCTFARLCHPRGLCVPVFVCFAEERAVARTGARGRIVSSQRTGASKATVARTGESGETTQTGRGSRMVETISFLC